MGKSPLTPLSLTAERIEEKQLTSSEIPFLNFNSPDTLDRKLRLATSPENLIKNRPNLLESRSPVVATLSPVQSVTISVTNSVISTISSTMSTRSEVEKCKEVIFKALNLKKNVSTVATFLVVLDLVAAV